MLSSVLLHLCTALLAVHFCVCDCRYLSVTEGLCLYGCVERWVIIIRWLESPYTSSSSSGLHLIQYLPIVYWTLHSSNNICIWTGLLVGFISPVIILLSLSKDLPIAHPHIHLYPNIFMIYVYYNIHIICMLLRTLIYFQAPLFFNQLHYYNTHMNTWTVVSVERSPKPVAGHCACVLSDKMLIFGGSQQGQGTK